MVKGNPTFKIVRKKLRLFQYSGCCLPSHNSMVCASSWAASPPQVLDFQRMMQSKVADDLAGIASLIVMATYEFPGLVSLRCDLNRMPNY
jgi:hypothetical protein